MKKIIVCALLVFSLDVHAEVYRWTDANGKVHFGDKKLDKSAENITSNLKTTNVDTSTTELKKMEGVFRKENDADREYRQQKSQPDIERLHQCSEAKNYLNTINGRVYFIGKDGKEVKITEAQRKQKVIDLQNVIKENCSN